MLKPSKFILFSSSSYTMQKHKGLADTMHYLQQKKSQFFPTQYLISRWKVCLEADVGNSVD